MAPIEVRGLTAALILLLSILHASAWAAPGAVRQSSFVSQVNRQRKQDGGRSDENGAGAITNTGHIYGRSSAVRLGPR